MGEYAMFGNQRIKIGTCENMYYLRYEDRHKVQKVEDSLDPAHELNLYWRLPIPDEDNNFPGNYDKFNRGEPLIGFNIEGATEHPGLIQLRHEQSGLMFNVSCFHGSDKLPEGSKDVKPFWNGKNPNSWELTSIKNEKDGIKAVVSCRFCNTSWKAEISEVIEYVKDTELKNRLLNYLKE